MAKTPDEIDALAAQRLAAVALFPGIERRIHVASLHRRPRRLGPVTIDSLLARDHRAHHADPRDLPLVFIPWKALVWLHPAYVVLAVLAMPTLRSALTLLISVYGVKLGYEWTHYLVHSDYRPHSRCTARWGETLHACSRFTVGELSTAAGSAG